MSLGKKYVIEYVLQKLRSKRKSQRKTWWCYVWCFEVMPSDNQKLKNKRGNNAKAVAYTEAAVCSYSSK